MEIVIWLIVGLVVGGIIGAVATWWISRARGGAVSVMQLKKENDQFRNEVTEHFVETARLINQMTDSYKQVFDHLSTGAEKLVDNKSLAERLPPASGEEVRLSQFGASSGSDGAAEDESDQAGSDAGRSKRSPGAAQTKDSESTDPLKNKPRGSASSAGRQAESKSESGKASGDKAGADSEAKSDDKSKDESDNKSGDKSEDTKENSASSKDAKENGASGTNQASAGSSDKSGRNA